MEEKNNNDFVNNKDEEDEDNDAEEEEDEEEDTDDLDLTNIINLILYLHQANLIFLDFIKDIYEAELKQNANQTQALQ